MKKDYEPKQKKVLPMARINTRIRPNQHKYIKAIAKKHKLTEGEVFRSIIDAHMSVNK
jgi:hypothetical protein